MVVGGPMIWLDKKLRTDFDNWTEDDTEQIVSLANWRSKLFFNGAKRIRERTTRFQEIYKATGKQPGDLPVEERKKWSPISSLPGSHN